MKIKVKNLGVIKQAESVLGDFTIICGENNPETYARMLSMVSWIFEAEKRFSFDDYRYNTRQSHSRS